MLKIKIKKEEKMKDTCNPLKDEFDKIIKLSDFLKENNAYKNFVKNFDLSYYSKYASSLEENVNFMNAFSWILKNTNDWRKLNNEWDKLKYVSYDMNWLFMEKN